ncbi:MAG: ABC transporter substrate-binding protein [Alphaproteobacteria bacterium]|nr:ABC transporter substrate-binding protein [Alphaproteobacteria bacterium]
MKLKHYLYLTIFFLCVLLLPLKSRAADDFTSAEARTWAEIKGREVLEILTSESSAEKYQKLDDILQNDVDLDHAARFVMGKYWRLMTDKQQSDYMDIFKRYTSALYKGYPIDIDKGDVTYTIDKVLPDKQLQNVYCTVFVKALEQRVDNASKGGIHIIFVLVKNDGKIKVRDLKITETSFLLAYRERFYKILHEDDDDDIDWFLEDLKQITADLEKENTAQLRQQQNK